eukprot:TRINITY_DN14412_c0_g2_i1.p1 TRINITY_DN14412_c0_g2~~TRINITY_DN14412_c0_g2_i1.p1  ORF type:complete len:826 (+),score=273.30 TRINITY_DN14412_c0_g2_i1:108-2585(+)
MSGRGKGAGGTPPDWLLNNVSPKKHEAHEHQIFSPTGTGGAGVPQAQRRPASGRRARTPAGYSSAAACAPHSEATYSGGAGGAGGNDSRTSLPAAVTRRPSYEDPLDVLQRQGTPVPKPNGSAGSRSAPPSRPASPPGGSGATPPLRPAPAPSGPAEFTMPMNPTGRHVVINCLATWGDPHYIGMNGIEFYDEYGVLIDVEARQVDGDPASINVLPDYTNDPRVVQNLVNGVCRTCDDRHLWLAPYTRGGDHIIRVDFGRSVTLSMVRFWNYNKGRTHASRGVRDVTISLNGDLIFAGEICQAPGILKGSEEDTEILLFTVDEGVLQHIDAQISSQHAQWREEDDFASGDFAAESGAAVSRPPTSHGKPQRGGPVNPHPFADRPTTTARGSDPPGAGPGPSMNTPPPRGEVVTVTIIAGWGDMQAVGMQGIAFLSDRKNPHSEIPVENVECSVPGSSDLQALLQEGGAHWRVGYDMDHIAEHPITLTFRLAARSMVCAIRISNYNERLAATSRGVKRAVVHVDGQLCSPPAGFYVRKATGHQGIDIGQTLSLSTNQVDFHSTVHSSLNNKNIADALHVAKLIQKPYPKEVIEKLGFEPPLFPVGYVVRIELGSTHGDRYYLGLNGVQLFDVRNEEIPLNPHNLQAVPKDITVLPQSAQDCRVLGNLVSPVHNSSSDAAIWLAPYSPGTVNLLYIVFEEPVAISRIAFWNYSKTPTRGVDACTVYVDDTLVYSGRLKPAPKGAATGDFSQHMVFTNDPIINNLDLIPSAPSEKSTSGVVFFDSGTVSDLDAMPQTSCGRPSSHMQARRPLRGCTAAGFSSGSTGYY